MKLSVPVFKQGDPRWANEPLGTSNLSLASDGCVIACMAMLAKFYGKDTDPSRFNKDTVRVGGFVADSLYSWASINKIYPDIFYKEGRDYLFDPSPIDLFKAELEAGRPFPVWLDVNPRLGGNQMHWVLVIGYEGNDFLINDPLFGETYFFKAKYGDIVKEVLGHRLYFSNKLATTQPSAPQTPPKGVFLEDAKFKELVAKATWYDEHPRHDGYACEYDFQKTQIAGRLTIANNLLNDFRKFLLEEPNDFIKKLKEYDPER